MSTLFILVLCTATAWPIHLCVTRPLLRALHLTY
jgi:hypothetical protein